MPKREVVRRIDQRAAGSGGGMGGGAASGNADTVDGLHASRTPTAGYLLALGPDAQFPAGVVALDDVDGVTVEASPADNEVLAYDASSGEWINQTAEEANLQEKLTTGGLTASSPLQADATRQVIGGALTLSLDQSGIDHGSVGGLGDDDHTQYLLASGARAGSASQAQDFSATGIKADAVAESTAGTGVTVDGVLLKDSGATFGADVNFAGYKAVAMTCDRGTSFPSSPQTGQWFYRTDCKCLFFYEGAWKPIVSFGDMVLYVDGTNGSDAPGQGFAPGSGATATIQYAINLIPPIVGGNVTVNIAAGTYAENLTITNRVIGPDYVIALVGALTQVASGTATDYKNTNTSAGTGKVNTVSGGSTTVTLSGGGSTSAFWVGAIIKANNISRVVTGIIDSTTFTVDSAVDWYNGGLGYSWYLWQSQIEDSSAIWTDDQHNNRLICTNTSDFDNNLAFVLDTVASTKRLWIAGNMNSTPGNYAIYTLGTTITGMMTLRTTSITFKYIVFDAGSNADAIQSFFSRSILFYGCKFTGGTSYGLYLILSRITIYGVLIDSARGIYSSISSSLLLYRGYIKTSHYNLFAYDRSSITIQQCYISGNYAAAVSVQAQLLSGIYGSSFVIKYTGGHTTAAYASKLSALDSIITTMMAPGYATPYSADAATYSFAS